MNQPSSPQSPGEAAPSVPILAPVILTGEEWDVLGGEDLRTKVPVLQRLGLMASMFSGLLPEQELATAQAVLGDEAPRHVALAAVQHEDGEQGHWIVVGGPNTGEHIAERSFERYGLGDPNEELKVRREAEAAKKAQQELLLRKQTAMSILQEATHKAELAVRMPEQRRRLDLDAGVMAHDVVSRIGNKPEGVALALAVAGSIQEPAQYHQLVGDVLRAGKVTDEEKRGMLIAAANHFANAKQRNGDGMTSAVAEARRTADGLYEKGELQFAVQMLAMAFGNTMPGSGRVEIGDRLASWISYQIDSSAAQPRA